MEVVTSFPAFFCDYVHGLMVMPNYIYVGVIALVFGLLTARLPGVFFQPILAAVVYLAAQAVIPPLLHHAEIVTPVFDLALAKQAVALYVVFLVADTVVFAIKKLIQAIF